MWKRRNQAWWGFQPLQIINWLHVGFLRSFMIICTNKLYFHIAQVTLNVFNYDTIPGKGLLQFLEKKKYTDVTFVVEGHQVPAHRCVVASQSEYFDCLLFGSMKEARSDEITLEDTPLEAFHVLLNYMYSGSVKILDMQVRVCYDHLLYTTQMMGIETTIDQEIFTLKIIRVKNFVFINFRGLFNSRNFFNSWVT